MAYRCQGMSCQGLRRAARASPVAAALAAEAISRRDHETPRHQAALKLFHRQEDRHASSCLAVLHRLGGSVMPSCRAATAGTTGRRQNAPGAVSLRHFYPERWNGEGEDFSLRQHASDLAAFIQGLHAGPCIWWGIRAAEMSCC